MLTVKIHQNYDPRKNTAAARVVVLYISTGGQGDSKDADQSI